MAKISKLYIHPFKSAAAISVEKVVVESYGFLHDREFMLVDEKGVLISQRKRPGLSLVIPEIRNEQLYLSAPGMEQISIPLRPGDDEVETVGVDVHKQIYKATYRGDDVSQWFRNYLKLDEPCLVVSVTPDQMYKKLEGKTNITIACHDSSPIHIVLVASVNELAAQVKRQMRGSEGYAPVTPEQFRPNIVIDDCEAFEEEMCGGLCIGDVLLRKRKDTTRCGMPDIDQRTGVRGKGIFETLMVVRKPPKGEAPVFGAHFIPLSLGTIRVGDEVVFSQS